MTAESKQIQIVARNRKARHDYQINATIEAGIELLGYEVKAVRQGKINLADSYAEIKNGEVYLKNLHISPYEMATGEPLDPLRPRRLLLHKREIYRLGVKTQQRGMTLIPLSIYFKGKQVKIELALASGRKKYDKRQAIAKEEAERRMKQAVRRDTDH